VINERRAQSGRRAMSETGHRKAASGDRFRFKATIVDAGGGGAYAEKAVRDILAAPAASSRKKGK